MKTALIAASALLAAMPAHAHRLDEYLQNTIVSVEGDRLRTQLTMTPGVAVFPLLLARIDADSSGDLSSIEQRVYAARVLRDLTFQLDGEPLSPRLTSYRFPPVAEMKEGRGEIELEFTAELPGASGARRLTIENRHESRISAYQVNCLVSRDPATRITAQKRNYTQSLYELDFSRTGSARNSLADVFRAPGLAWLLPVALLAAGRLLLARRASQRNA